MRKHKILVLLISLITMASICLYADDVSAQKSEKSTKYGNVDVVSENEQYIIQAHAYGKGTTLDAAKMDAINAILPELIHKTQDLPGSMQQSWTINGATTGQGIDNILAKIRMQGYWELENEMYYYQMIMIIDNRNEVTDSETSKE